MPAARNALYLRTYLTALGLSNAELAELAGVKPRTVSHWLSGRNTVPSYVWRRLADVRENIRIRVEAAMSRWAREGHPLTFTLPLSGKRPAGPGYVAAWETVERLESKHVFVTLTRPVTEPHT